MTEEIDVAAMKAHLERCKGLLEAVIPYIERAARTHSPYDECDHNAVELARQLQQYKRPYDGRSAKKSVRGRR